MWCKAAMTRADRCTWTGSEKMSSGRIAAWTWGLIFGGMLVMALGLTVRRADSVLGWLLVAGSAVAIAVGVILIWVRSTMNNPP